jgi:hypothetical protein
MKNLVKMNVQLETYKEIWQAILQLLKGQNRSYHLDEGINRWEI